VPGDTPTLRVLLVEDSVLLARRLEELIRRLPGVDLVAIVDTEDEAISRIADCRPDTIIVDLQLRRGSGFGVMRALPRTGPPAEGHRSNQLQLGPISTRSRVTRGHRVSG
jgi:DNA-binding NarL/FixJ family response regulator